MILIVDDSMEDAVLLERNLRDAGVTAQVRTVGTGSEALNYLRDLRMASNDPAVKNPVVFLDLKLPDLSGYEVLKQITAEPGLRRAVVVVHSGIANGADIDGLYEAGANSFLRKASDTKELRQIVEYYKGHFM